MYDLYVECCQERGSERVTLSFYRNIFSTCFNLSFHRPQTDTCNTCDKLKTIIDHGLLIEKNDALVEKELHLRKAESAKSEMLKA